MGRIIVLFPSEIAELSPKCWEVLTDQKSRQGNKTTPWRCAWHNCSRTTRAEQARLGQSGAAMSEGRNRGEGSSSLQLSHTSPAGISARIFSDQFPFITGPCWAEKWIISNSVYEKYSAESSPLDSFPDSNCESSWQALLCLIPLLAKNAVTQIRWNLYQFKWIFLLVKYMQKY